MIEASEPDCLQCKVIGSAGSFAVASYLIYNSFIGKKTLSHKWTLMSLGFGNFC